jgi:hypothetical protein
MFFNLKQAIKEYLDKAVEEAVDGPLSQLTE